MLKVYHSERGFPTPTTTFFEGVEQGVRDVGELFFHFRTKPVEHWAFHRKLVNTAKCCFTGDNQKGLKQWLQLVVDNPSNKMGYLHYQFLLETIDYLRTGYRRVSPMTAMSLIDQTPHADKKTLSLQQSSVKAREKLREVCQSLDVELDKAFISKWLSYPDGAMDLTYTLFLLFGGISDKPVEPVYFTTPDGVAQ